MSIGLVQLASSRGHIESQSLVSDISDLKKDENATITNQEGLHYSNYDITFFHAKYEKHIGFWWNHVSLRCSPDLDLGTYSEADLSPIHGHYLYSLTLIVNFSSISSSEYDSLAKLKYVDWLGYALIRDAVLTIDGGIVEHLDGDSFAIKAFVDSHNIKALRRMSCIKTSSALYGSDKNNAIQDTYESSKKSFSLHIPLLFDTLREPLPIGIFSKSNVRMGLRLANGSDLLICGPTHSAILDDESYIEVKCNLMDNKSHIEPIYYKLSSLHDFERTIIIEVHEIDDMNKNMTFNFILGNYNSLLLEASQHNISEIKLEQVYEPSNNQNNITKNAWEIKSSVISLNLTSISQRPIDSRNAKIDSAEILANYVMEIPINSGVVKENTSEPNTSMQNTQEHHQMTSSEKEKSIPETTNITKQQNIFMLSAFERIIYQTQFQSQISIKPALRHPCSEMWIILDTAPSRNNPLDGLLKFDTIGSSLSLIHNLSISCNGRNIVNTTDGSYETSVVSWIRHHSNFNQSWLKDVHIVSFALRPSDIQPSGSLNISKLDQITVNIRLSPNVDSALIPRLRLRLLVREHRFYEIKEQRAMRLF